MIKTGCQYEIRYPRTGGTTLAKVLGPAGAGQYSVIGRGAVSWEERWTAAESDFPQSRAAAPEPIAPAAQEPQLTLF